MHVPTLRQLSTYIGKRKEKIAVELINWRDIVRQRVNSGLPRTCFYAKAKHLLHRWLRFLADRNNIVVMDINADVRESIQKVAAMLMSGKNIIIIPEGTRTLDGDPGYFKKTFAILSKELNVPVTIRGAFEALPAGSLLPRPFHRVSVCFQPPVFPEDHGYESLKDLVQEKVRNCLHVRSSRCVPTMLAQNHERKQIVVQIHRIKRHPEPALQSDIRVDCRCTGIRNVSTATSMHPGQERITQYNETAQVHAGAHGMRPCGEKAVQTEVT
jgi:hypothetical protein